MTDRSSQVQNTPAKKRPGALARVRTALENVARRADTLLESGYRFELCPDVRARILVIKPGQTAPAYAVDFFYDYSNCKWRYRCTCGMYRRAHAARQWDIALEPECKHGRRALSLFFGALQFVEHIRPLPPMLDGVVLRAQADPNGPQPRACLDQNNPWPTKRAVVLVPAWEAVGRALLP